jgi:hypothetical protein
MFPADTSSTVPWFQRKRFLILTWNGSLSSLISSNLKCRSEHKESGRRSAATFILINKYSGEKQGCNQYYHTLYCCAHSRPQISVARTRARLSFGALHA